MLRNSSGRLTVEGNHACRDCTIKVKDIYNYYRNEGYSIEETFYMICSAASALVHIEALRGDKNEKD